MTDKRRQAEYERERAALHRLLRVRSSGRPLPAYMDQRIEEKRERVRELWRGLQVGLFDAP